MNKEDIVEITRVNRNIYKIPMGLNVKIKGTDNW